MEVKSILPEFNASNISAMAIKSLQSDADNDIKKFLEDLYSCVKNNLSNDEISEFRLMFQGKHYYPLLSDEDIKLILKERGFNTPIIKSGHDIDCDGCSYEDGCNKWLFIEWNIIRKRKR